MMSKYNVYYEVGPSVPGVGVREVYCVQNGLGEEIFSDPNLGGLAKLLANTLKKELTPPERFISFELNNGEGCVISAESCDTRAQKLTFRRGLSIEEMNSLFEELIAQTSYSK